ncbi:hypothetical protein P8864_03150 [Priestia flexa]|nr:hypothetical protein [Priestia flexa]MEC0664963.1 hypothetical protein [Priestia flexa]
MERRTLDSCGKEMGTASVRLLEAIILLCPKLLNICTTAHHYIKNILT